MDTQQVEILNKPWGTEEILVNTGSYVMKRITITSGNRMSLQYHDRKEETIYVVSGILIVWTSEEFYDHVALEPNSVYHVQPGTVHRFGSPDSIETVIIECSTCELDDVVRLADDYDRS